MKYLSKFVKDESGATAVEYAIIIGIIAAALVTLVTTFSGEISTLFGALTTALA